MKVCRIHAQSEAIQRALTPRLTSRRGWNVYDNGPDHHPTTGRFRAWRVGVAVGHSTLDGLLSMIDAREQRANVSQSVS
jgi:hypothetical protein